MNKLCTIHFSGKVKEKRTEHNGRTVELNEIYGRCASGKESTPQAERHIIKNGKELQERAYKYRLSLGKDGGRIQDTLDARIQELENAKSRIEQDITDIWDGLYEIKSSEDVQNLIECIRLVLQKGISSSDQSSLEEVKGNLEDFIVDVDRLSATDTSRKEFEKVSAELGNKYKDSEFDFEVNEILDEVIRAVAERLDKKEAEWRSANLTLGEKNRSDVHKWKEKTKFLPEYLSEKTYADIKMIDAEAEIIIKESKIEDVIFYFEKLSKKEKVECIEKLSEMID